MSETLEQINARWDGGEPLTAAEIETVLSTTDLIGLGALADTRRCHRHGDRVTFVRVATVRCDNESATIADHVPRAAGEVRIVGAPSSTQAAVDVTRRVVGCSSGTPVTGFALDQLAQLCDSADGLERLLGALKVEGLSKISEAHVEVDGLVESLDVAEASGLDVATLTLGAMAETGGVDLIRRVAALRTSVANIRAFDPLPQTPGPHVTTGYGDARQVALARLLVDNIDSIQVDWAGYGPKLAQVALTFGADDVDSVSVDESDTQGWRRTPLEEITRNIRAAALVPVQRNGRFEILAE